MMFISVVVKIIYENQMCQAAVTYCVIDDGMMLKTSNIVSERCLLHLWLMLISK